jgi:cold shock protein
MDSTAQMPLACSKRTLRYVRGRKHGYRHSQVVQRHKGLRFIQPDSGGKDVFVHISAVERAGLDGLREGQKISYDVQVERGKEAAANLKA